MSPYTRYLRFDGLTVFAVMAFVAGLAAIAALDRVGAPEGLVRAGGPILALFGFAAFGLSARNPDLSSFVTGAQGLGAVAGGLGVAAIAAGQLLCLDGSSAASADPPIRGLALGLALGALVYAPVLRRFGATSPADVVASRYPRSAARMVVAAALGASAALTAFAGYSVAVAAVANAGVARSVAEIVVAVVLGFGALPGGLIGLASCAAASGVALVGVAAVEYASGWRIGVPLADVAGLASGLDFGSPAELAPTLATTLASAGLFGFAPSAAASRSAAQAAKAGFVAVALSLALAAAVGPGLPSFASSPASPVTASLAGAATLAGALSLALAGVYGFSRALGVALAGPPRPFGAIPSVRLARMRAAALIVIVICAVGDSNGLLDARAALSLAMALILAFAAPLLVLAAIPRSGPASAFDGTLAAMAVAAYRLAPGPQLLAPSELFETALLAAAAAVVAGSFSCLIRPRKGPASTRGPDAFAEAQP